MKRYDRKQQTQKKMVRRIIVFLLTLMLAMVMLQTAFAGEEGEVEGLGSVEAEEAYQEIMPFNLIPAGVDLGAAAGNIINVTHGGTGAGGLRTALAGSTTRAIRLMNDITMDGAVISIAGTVHIFSNTNTIGESFAITRTGGTARTFNTTGTVNLWNVRITRPAGLTTDGGGINVDGGHLHLREGSVISHSRQSLGAVFINNGTVTMHGGIIEHNVGTFAQSGNGGGGVHVTRGTSFNMTGGIIRNNQAFNTGAGVQVAGSGALGAATFNMSGGVIQNNVAMRNDGTANAAGAGGGIHLNSDARVALSGDALIIGNRAAAAGGGIRYYGDVFAGMSLTITGNVRIVDNIAGTNGGGISTRVAAHHINITNWHGEISGNVAGYRGIGNPNAGGSGGGIHIQNDSGAGTRLTIGAGSTGRITRNTGDNGGGIYAAIGNLPATAIASRLAIAPSVTFDGNWARNGIRVDENLGHVNRDHLPHVGSFRWVGVNPIGPTAQWRNHIFNNADINVRTWIYIRPVEFETIGTAGADSEMTASVTRVARVSGTATGQGPATPPITGTNIEIESGDWVTVFGTAANTSQVSYVVTYYPWNTYRPWGPAGNPARTWRSANINAAGVGTPTAVANSSTTLANRNVPSLPNNTGPYRVDVIIDYRYHEVRFQANPSTETTGGTVDGQASVTRNLRESSATLSSANTPGGNPIGTPPTPEARPGWSFIGWTHNGNPITPEEIAAMHVTGPLTFVANFEVLAAAAIRIEPEAITLGNLEYEVFTAVVLDQQGNPAPNQESFVINWSSANTANVTVSPASNPAGQGNTTTATVTLMAPAGSVTEITATLGNTNISATATVTVTHISVPHSITVTPASSNLPRGGDVELTAVVLNQFGNPMPNQNNFVINWASATPGNVTVATAYNPAGQPNTTTATATATAVIDSTNSITATLDGTTIFGTATVNIIYVPAGALVITAPTLIDFGTNPITLQEMDLYNPVVSGDLTITDTRTTVTNWNVGVIIEEELTHTGLGTHVLTNALRYRMPGSTPVTHTLGSTRTVIYTHTAGLGQVTLSDRWTASNGFRLIFPGTLARVGEFTGVIIFDVIPDQP